MLGTVGPPGVDVGKGVFAERLEIAESGIPGVVGAAGVCCALLDMMAYSENGYCALEFNTLILADIDSVTELVWAITCKIQSCLRRAQQRLSLPPIFVIVLQTFHRVCLQAIQVP